MKAQVLKPADLICEKPVMDFVERVCERHGSYKAGVIHFGKGELFSGCPRCIAEHEAAAARGKSPEPNAWATSEKERLRLRSMNIEPEFYGASLSSYRAETPSQKAALAAAKELVKSDRKFCEALFCGPNGVGKTHLACAVARELGGAVCTMYEIGCRIRHTYTPLAVETELDAVKKLASLPFLAIDEVGRTKGGDAEKSWLSHIIDKRHSRFLPTMLLSNRRLERSLPKDKAQWSLESFLDSDIVSRFRGGAIIEIEGADWRARRN